MEWAVWTASSDSEDGTSQEINEEEGTPSIWDQQDSLCGAGEQSTKVAPGYVGLTFVKEDAATRNGWDFMDPAKTEAGKEPSNKDSQDLIHFVKQQGIDLSAPDSMGSTSTVNISEGDGNPDCAPVMSEEEDEEAELAPQENLEESAEELEVDSYTNEVSQKLNPGSSETERNKRNLTEEDGLGCAYKLVKRLEPPQENQMPCARTECGESALDPSCAQWNESFQSEQLEGNCAAEEPVNCTESKAILSHSSKLVEHQKLRTGKWIHHCAECNITCETAYILDCHIKSHGKSMRGHKCPECSRRFGTENGMKEHRSVVHKVAKPLLPVAKPLLPVAKPLLSVAIPSQPVAIPSQPVAIPSQPVAIPSQPVAIPSQPVAKPSQPVAKPSQPVAKPSQPVALYGQGEFCNIKFNSSLLSNPHHQTAHVLVKFLKCPECNMLFPNQSSVRKHRNMIHFQCTECNLTFKSALALFMHEHTAVGTQESFKCPDCNKPFFNSEIMMQHRFIIHNVKENFSCPDCAKEFISLGMLMAHQCLFIAKSAK